MIPLAIDPQHVTLAVAGNGPLALRRLRALRRAGAVDALLFADAPAAGLAGEAGAYLRNELPGAAALGGLHILYIADLDPKTAITLAIAARASRVLVNTEDVPAFCDFHSVAEVRRGDLLLTVSTHGAAPGLAGAIRRGLESCFTAEWAERVNEIAALRQGWRAEGVPLAEVARRIDAIVDERGWLCCSAPL